jgi:hypothetical protein
MITPAPTRRASSAMRASSVATKRDMPPPASSMARRAAITERSSRLRAVPRAPRSGAKGFAGKRLEA